MEPKQLKVRRSARNEAEQPQESDETAAKQSATKHKDHRKGDVDREDGDGEMSFSDELFLPQDIDPDLWHWAEMAKARAKAYI